MIKKIFILYTLFGFTLISFAAPNTASISPSDSKTDLTETSKKPKKADSKKESKAAATNQDHFIPMTQVGGGITAYSGTSDGNKYASAGGSLFAGFGISKTVKLFIYMPFLQYAPVTNDFAAIGDMMMGFMHTAYNGVKNGTGSKVAWGLGFGFPTGSTVAQNTSNDYSIRAQVGYLYVMDKMGNSNLGFSFQVSLDYGISFYDGNGLIIDANGNYISRDEAQGTIDQQMLGTAFQFSFYLWKGGALTISPHISYAFQNSNGGTPWDVSLGFGLHQMVSERISLSLMLHASFIGNPLRKYGIGFGVDYLLG